MQPMKVDAGTADEPSTVSFGPLVVDLEGFAVTVDGRDVAVTYAEFRVLRELVLQPFRAVSRTALVGAIETRPHDGKPAHGPASERAIDLHVSRLRRKLAAAGYDCIRTMRFVGYRFVPPQ